MIARIPGLLLLLALPSGAQTALPDLQSRLVHQPLYLRGQWSGKQLGFDNTGTLVGPLLTDPFTLSGIDIRSLKLDSKGLRLDGKRVGVEFIKGNPIRVPLKDSIRIEITAPPDGNYTVALDNIFQTGLAGFVPSLPSIWQGRSLNLLLDPSYSLPEATRPPAPPKRITGAVMAPVVLFAPEPKFSDAARQVRLSGNVRVYLLVDEQGLPQNIRILRPLGLGLDEMAADAVSRYRFKPAKENGKPIRVEMNVEVNFQVN